MRCSRKSGRILSKLETYERLPKMNM